MGAKGLGLQRLKEGFEWIPQRRRLCESGLDCLVYYSVYCKDPVGKREEDGLLYFSLSGMDSERLEKLVPTKGTEVPGQEPGASVLEDAREGLADSPISTDMVAEAQRG